MDQSEKELLEIRETWDHICWVVKKSYELSDVECETWIKPLQAVSFKDSILCLHYPEGTEFIRSYINRKYADFIEMAIWNMGYVVEVKMI